MITVRREYAAAVLLALGLLPGWASAADRPPGDRKGLAWVEQRVKDWQPTKDERRFDEIGWAKDIRDALRLAKEHGRPVFLFTYDGASLATYRC
jgi:hypothetical protein